MLMTLDHWLARFFGAKRRDERASPMAQRAAFGHDGMELRQIASYDYPPEWEEDARPAPGYKPYVRQLRAPEPAPQPMPARADATAAPAAPPPEPSCFDREIERARMEALATARSQEFFRNPPAASAPVKQFHSDTVVAALENAAAPHFWQVDKPNVRFTRTPESSIARRKEEDEARRRAEEEMRLKTEEDARAAREARLAQAQSLHAQPRNGEAPRVRYVRTPDAPRAKPEPAAPVAAPVAAFGAFGSMGARFSFGAGFAAAVPVIAAPPAAPVAPAPEKLRVRVKAGAAPAQEPQPAQEPRPAPQKRAPRVLVAPDPAPAPRAWDLDKTIVAIASEDYEPLGVDMLSEPPENQAPSETDDQLEVNADTLEKTLEDFGVRGDILNAHPGPVVTLYEFEPAPGIKSSRVIGLADDIARSMSAVSARVAVVPGRNAIGIELPNPRRETVYLRELVAAPDFADSKHKLAIALGKTIGGEPVIVDLAKMPHLLVAGTTGSGKSVAINTMILSLLYRLTPQQCRLIMVDPKMLELSVYDGIPHLLTPVVTDPKKAVVALKWAVREMEDRYRKMSKLGVRNIDGFNARVNEAREKGEVISRAAQTGFDRETGEATFGQEQIDLTALPYIVVIVDEMADLMMVAGKEIEGAIQRLAQMARAAGIHIIMATQRPSVDVITGTIKANFPTRISFQVTSKIDSRTILGEMGAEQLLGQGDMLYMAGGGRISRVHGPFVSDAEVERVVAHLKMQGQPEYLDAVTVEDEPEADDGDAAAVSAGDDEFGRPLRPRGGRRAARQEVLDFLCPAAPVGGLQQGGVAG